MVSALSLAIIATLAAPASPPLLCVGTTPETISVSLASCIPTGDRIEVEPATTDRLYIRVSADRTTARLGRISRRRRSVDEGNPATLHLGIDGSGKSWPTKTELTIADERFSWSWSASGPEVAQLERVILPRGSYTLTLRANDHDPLTTGIPNQPTIRLGTLRLHALPVIAGQVLDRATGTGLIGAAISIPEGETIAVTDYEGRFETSLPAGPMPERLLVSYGGYGTAGLPLPRARADAILPPITLGPAGTLQVILERDTEKYPTVTTRLRRRQGNTWQEIAEGTLEAADQRWKVESLDAGEYTLVLRGPTPLQQRAEALRILPAETTTLDLTIEPIALEGRVTRAHQPVPAPSLAIKASPGGWTATIVGDDAGEFAGELWQAGRFATLVSASSLAAPYAFASVITSAEGRAHWNIRVPSGAITGTIKDADTRKPIANASLTLDSELHNGDTTSLGARIDDEGRFAYEGIAAGTHTLTAEAPGYATYRSPPFVLRTDDEQRDFAITLSPARDRAVIVTAADGQPLSGAVVLTDASLAGPPVTTDAQGRAKIPTGPGNNANVLAIPRNGSFGMARTPTLATELTRIVVPPATGTLVVRALDEDSGAPISNIRVLIRYNGVFLTPTLAQAAAVHAGMKFSTDGNGTVLFPALPAGTYELWTYATYAEAENIIATGARAAAVVGIASGEYVVRLQFRRSGGTSAPGTNPAYGVP